MPTLRIPSSGSDFCDTCTTLKNTMASIPQTDPQYISSKQFRDVHRAHARDEFQHYKQYQRQASEEHGTCTLHLLFDFVEKVLLPKLQRQPSQPYFITGLNCDLLGISCSNTTRNYVFGLPEGHWSNEKTADSVVSMLHYTLGQLKRNGKTAGFSQVKLHADNCSGQNKNRYVLWCLTWRVLVGLDDRIDRYFLIAGHTQNVCDGAFGHVKRRFRKSDVHVPAEMNEVIEKSSESKHIMFSVR